MQYKKRLTAFFICFLAFSILISSNGYSVTTNVSEQIILITGFEAFDVYDVNPSELIANELNNTHHQNYTIRGIVLPVNYTTAPAKMKKCIEDYDPILIFSLGLAGNAKTIQIETYAVNLRIDPDQHYPLFTLKKVNLTGPWIKKATIDISSTLNNINEKDIPVQQSYSAGLYLCNAILYETLCYQDHNQRIIPTGFIHVPQLDTQDPEGMPFDDMIQSVLAAISAHIK